MSPWNFLALLFLTATAVQAADIQVIPLDHGAAFVTLTGDINVEDGDVFRTKTERLSKATVAFSSDGGRVISAINIGTTIHLKGFDTLVPDGTRCASACALAWLGGANRFMGRSAHIGFHAVFTNKNGQSTENSAGNAVVGAYLSKIGLSYNAIMFITEAAPTEVNWLYLSDAARRGITVSEFHADSPALATALARPPSSPSLIREPNPANNPPNPPKSQIQLSREEQKMAALLKENFQKRYREAGLNGVNESIAACYKSFKSAVNATTGEYCIALDVIATALDKTVMNELHRSANPFNNQKEMHERILDVALKLDKPSLWLERGYAIATEAATLLNP